MLFAASAQQSIEDRQFKRLGELLGVYWTRESVEAMLFSGDAPDDRPRETLLIPHLLGMQPQLEDYIRKAFGSSRGISPPDWYRTLDKSQVVEGYKMDKDEFVRLAGMFTGLIPKDYMEKMRPLSQMVGRPTPVRGQK